MACALKETDMVCPSFLCARILKVTLLFFFSMTQHFLHIIKQHTSGVLLGIFNYCAKLSVIETKSIVSNPSFFFPQVHPVKLKA